MCCLEWGGSAKAINDTLKHAFDQVKVIDSQPIELCPVAMDPALQDREPTQLLGVAQASTHSVLDPSPHENGKVASEELCSLNPVPNQICESDDQL